MRVFRQAGSRFGHGGVRASWQAALFAAAAIALPANAGAETLGGVIAHTYTNNPELQSARKQLGVTNESYPQALANWFPTLSASHSTARTTTWTNTSLNADEYLMQDVHTQTLSYSQTLFNGGANFATLRQAEKQIDAQRASLEASENTVLLNATTAYMDVIRDRAIKTLRAGNVEVLNKRLETTQVQFDLQKSTLTDLSQARSRLARARANYSTADANLRKSRASFQQVVGFPAEDLVMPEPPVGLPTNLEDALAQSKRVPAVRQARANVDVAEAALDVAKRARLPSLALNSSASRTRTGTHDVTGAEQAKSWTGGVTLTMPLYQSGAELSRIRAARETVSQRVVDLRTATLQAQKTIDDAWQDLTSAKDRVTSHEEQVASAKTALESTTAEYDVGLRTLLNLLDAQQEFLDAEVNLVGARRDVIVQSYTLLSAMGWLTARDLDLEVPLYDVEGTFEKQKYNLINTSVE